MCVSVCVLSFVSAEAVEIEEKIQEKSQNKRQEMEPFQEVCVSVCDPIKKKKNRRSNDL